MRRRAGHAAGQPGSVSLYNLRKVLSVIKTFGNHSKSTAVEDECLDTENSVTTFHPPTSNNKVFTRTRGYGNTSQVTSRQIWTKML